MKKKSKFRRKTYGCVLGVLTGLNILSLIAESNFTAASCLALGILIGTELEKMIIVTILEECKHE